MLTDPSARLALLVSVGAGIAALVIGLVTRRAWREYRRRFQHAAARNLGELFLFVDPRHLFAVQSLVLVLGAGAVLLAGGGPFLALAWVVALGASPPLVYRVLRERRRRAAVAQLPDTLLALSTNLRSGLSLLQSLEATLTFQPAPLSQELGLVLRELRLGVGYAQAMDNLHRRLPEVDVQLVTAAMKISREIGGNLAETLERISDTLRKRLQMEGKIRSLTAQGKLQGLVMTGLPLFLIAALTQLEPQAMRYLFEAWYGWATLAAILLLEVLGYHFIRRIVSIDV